VPGPEPRTSDEEILRIAALAPRPFITATDVVKHESVDITRQAVVKRLNKLSEHGYLNEKQVGGAAKVWWLTPEGRQKAATE